MLCVSPAAVKALGAQSLQRWKSSLFRAPDSPSAIPAAEEGREAVCPAPSPCSRGGPVSQPLPASHSSYHKAAHLSSLCLGAVYLCPPPPVWWPHDDMELMPLPAQGSCAVLILTHLSARTGAADARLPAACGKAEPQPCHRHLLPRWTHVLAFLVATAKQKWKIRHAPGHSLTFPEQKTKFQASPWKQLELRPGGLLSSFLES